MSSFTKGSQHGLILSNNATPKHYSRRFASFVMRVRRWVGPLLTRWGEAATAT